jgi:NAD(P)H dehydrogenase (quinone)
MIVKGSSKGAHYGPVCVGEPDDKALERCRLLGAQIAALAVRLFG